MVDGLRFDSKREAKRWGELLVLYRSGKITDLRRQVRIPLRVNGQVVCRFVADFVYLEAGVRIVEDCKGFRTAIYRLKKRLVAAAYGVEIRET